MTSTDFQIFVLKLLTKARQNNNAKYTGLCFHDLVACLYFLKRFILLPVLFFCWWICFYSKCVLVDEWPGGRNNGSVVSLENERNLLISFYILSEEEDYFQWLWHFATHYFDTYKWMCHGVCIEIYGSSNLTFVKSLIQLKVWPISYSDFYG